MRYLILLQFLWLVALSPLSVWAEVTLLEGIRKEFEIYQRFTGEIEILTTDDTKEIDDVLKRTQLKRLAVREMLDRAQENGRTTDRKCTKTQMYRKTDEYIEPFLYYIAVERAVASRSIQQGKLDDAVQSFQYAYRLAEVFAESDSMALRSTAARIRLQMLETAQSIVMHPLLKEEHCQALHKVLEEQINKRTTDTVIWERYRDEGLQFLSTTVQSNQKNAKYDMAVFERVSDAIIESCSIPYFQRQPVLRYLEEELQQRRGMPNEPTNAILLLQEVSQLMQLFAQERSGIETAYLALSAALGKRTQNSAINFLTGNKYEIRLITDGVMCTYQGNIKPFYVPYP